MMKSRVCVLAALLALPVPAVANPAWTIQSSPTLSSLYGVSHADPNTWVAVGDGGVILRSADAGVSWSAVTSPVGDALRGVSMLGDLGIAVGIAGRVLRTTDRGASWTLETRFTTRNLYGVSVGPGVAVITGEEGQIFVSTDNGVNWTLHTAGTASILFGVSLSGSTAVGVGGQGAIVMSTDSGQGWGLTIPGNALTFFYATSFPIATTGWAVGTASTIPSLVIKSTDSGFVWAAQTAPTTQTLMGVSFPSIDVGTAVGFAGTILRTEDGGNQWTAQDGNTAQNLNAVSFSDSQLGIAVGDAGTILRTTSGGTVGVESGASALAFGFDPAMPNPIHGAAAIGVRIPTAGAVRLAVYDVSGARVATLLDGPLSAGHHVVLLHAESLRSGLYFCRLETARGDRSAVRRLALVR